MKKRINVTLRDIEKGIALSGAHCPVARACRRVIPETKGVGVSYVRVRNGMDRYVPLPEKAQTFISRFDQFLPVEPFTFTLDLPE